MLVLSMPKLGVTMTEGVIVEWKVSAGDTVRKGDVIAAIESDKMTVQYESPEAGVVQELLAEEDEEVEVGAPICTLREEGE